MSIDGKAEYYDAGGIETMDIIRAKLTPEQFKGFLLGNALKYLCRLNFKGNPVRDAEKAENYCIMLDEHQKGKEELSALAKSGELSKPKRCFGCKNFGTWEVGHKYSVICVKNKRGLHAGYVAEAEAENTLTPDWCPGREE